MDKFSPAQAPYRGRFAPSPTGPLHAGSLVAALGSWLDARAHGGAWLLRIEDVDRPRVVPGAATAILEALAALGLEPDEAVVVQSARAGRYDEALARLATGTSGPGHLFGCGCSRRRIGESLPEGAPGIYPGTCRGRPPAEGLAWRLQVPAERIGFVDRAFGPFAQQLDREVGDFVLRRADGIHAYQLAVVVDDADAAITDVVRGADLLDNTPRQILLQGLLGLPTPRYLHLPLVLADDGRKLSKQNGASALRLDAPLEELERAWGHLGHRRIGAANVARFLDAATRCWRERLAGDGPAADRGAAPDRERPPAPAA